MPGFVSAVPPNLSRSIRSVCPKVSGHIDQRRIFQGTHHPRDTLSKGRNIRRLEDTRVGDEIALHHRKIRLTESNAKCRYLKKWPLTGTLRQVFYLSEAPPPMTPQSPRTHCIRVYRILIHTGKGGGVELTREKFRGAIVYKPGRKY